LQSLETDGAQAAKTFTVNNETFLFVANGGSVGRYETKSRLYKVLADGTLTVVCHKTYLMPEAFFAFIPVPKHSLLLSPEIITRVSSYQFK